MKTQLKAAAVGGVAILATTACLVQASAEDTAPSGKEAQMSGKHSLKGVWTVTVDPLPNPGGDPPPFESTLAFGGAHVVNEITSRMDTVSAGLGTWERTGKGTYRSHWLKYRFDSTGAYIGKTVVTEDITVLGKNHYEGAAVTQVIDSAGNVVAQIESDVTAERLEP